jgi:peptide/nickel transport system ATP-binding protein
MADSNGEVKPTELQPTDLQPVELTVDGTAPRSTDNEAPILSVRELTVEFKTDDGILRAVDHVSFDVHHNETLGIVGESGSGKSVSSLALMGLLPRSAKISGSIRYRDAELIGMDRQELNAYRGKKIAMIFQDPMTSLNPYLTVERQMTEVL